MLYSSDGKACRAFQAHKAPGNLVCTKVLSFHVILVCSGSELEYLTRSPRLEGPLSLLVRGGLWYLKWSSNLQNSHRQCEISIFLKQLCKNQFPLLCLWWISDFTPGVYILGEGGSCPDRGTCKGIIKGTHAHHADDKDKVTTSKYGTHCNSVDVHRCRWYLVLGRWVIINDMFIRCVQ